MRSLVVLACRHLRTTQNHLPPRPRFRHQIHHQTKTKSDSHDAEVLARLLRGNNFPLAYAYPAERRGLRDLLRTRLRLVGHRTEIYGHIHTVRRQLNLAPAGSDVKYR